jgi:RNA polymerase sigma-70 factor (ECF subfamily)
MPGPNDPLTAPPCPDRDSRDRVQLAPALDAVTRLVHEHRGRLARVATSEGLTAEDALDAVQEAFQSLLTLPQAALLCEAPEDARKLLVTLTRNIARNRRRLHAVARPHSGDDRVLGALPSPEPAADELIAAAEEHARLAGCLGRLAGVQRAVVTLRMLDGRDGAAVARALGISPGNVAVLLHRAKGKLAACMGEAAPAAIGARPERLKEAKR